MNLYKYLYIPLSLIILSSCKISYSFTSGNFSEEIKTVSIQNFYNNSGAGPANLGDLFTESLKDYYQQNTRDLSIVNEFGDLQLEGKIASYTVSPVSPQANEISALTRLTINVQTKFLNTKDEKQNFDKNFSFYADFAQEKNLSDVEDELINEIFEQIILDIFNKTQEDW